MKPYLPLLLLCLAACGAIPVDPDGTLDHIRADGRVRVGRVLGASQADLGVASRVLARVVTQTGARAVYRGGSLEPLLLDLEAGRLDVVVGGRFDEKTPWTTRVALGPPLAQTKGTATHVVARNGENAWIILLARAAKATGAQS